MADNVTLSAGSADGAVIATDDVGGVHYQIAKIIVGALNAGTLLTGGAGNVDAGTIRVTIATDQTQLTNALKVDGSAVTQPVSHAALTELAAAINASSQMDVNLAASGITLAISHAALTELAAAINASSQMDVNIAASNATLTVASHAVTNAGTFVVQVDGAALTSLQLLDDAVFAEDVAAQAADKGVAVLAVRRDADTSLVGTDNDYANLQVDARGALKVEAFSGETLPVSLATVPSHAVTNAGTFATQVDGAALTALQLIDDVVFAEDAAASSGEKGVSNLGVRVDTPNTALTNTDGDYGHMTLNKLGSLRTAYPEDDLATAATKHTYKYYTNAGAVTDGIIWSPAAGTRWFLTSLTINVSAAATVTIEDDVAAGDVVRFKFELAANSGVSIPLNPPMYSGEDAADLLVTTTAGNVYITAVGYEI